MFIFIIYVQFIEHFKQIINLIHAKRLIFSITNYLNIENFIYFFKLNDVFYKLINDDNVVDV